MGNQLGTLNLQGVFAKVTLHHPICFFCLPWEYKAYYNRGVAISKNGPRVPTYEDDSVLISCCATKDKCQTIMYILAIYERGSGQKIIREKTNTLFSSNTPQPIQAQIQLLLGVPAIRQFEKHLGLPALVGREKKEASSIYFKEMVWKKLQSWKEKLLSIAGREVLIKSVIEAIPTYTMSYFKLSKCLIKDLEVLICKFWWGYNRDSRKVHQVSWERLCEAKDFNGLGFKEIERFNDAFLTKQFWWMIHNPESLCYRVFKARFFPNRSIVEAKDSITGSYVQKSILSTRDVIWKGMVWRIGNGQSVRIKDDKWLPMKPSCRLSHLSLQFCSK